MKDYLINGLLCLHSCGEADDILYSSDIDDPLAEHFEDILDSKIVTIRYWTSLTKLPKDDLIRAHLEQLYSGKGSAAFGHCYSEYTGYLWTDEEGSVDGHDVILELKSLVGRWLYMEIEVHEPPAAPPAAPPAPKPEYPYGCYGPLTKAHHDEYERVKKTRDKLVKHFKKIKEDVGDLSAIFEELQNDLLD